MCHALRLPKGLAGSVRSSPGMKVHVWTGSGSKCHTSISVDEHQCICSAIPAEPPDLQSFQQDDKTLKSKRNRKPSYRHYHTRWLRLGCGIQKNCDPAAREDAEIEIRWPEACRGCSSSLMAFVYHTRNARSKQQGECYRAQPGDLKTLVLSDDVIQ